MSVRVAVQMDPLESINISGDSTFAIMLGAQARAYSLYHYLAEDLTYQEGRLYAGAHEVSVQPVPGDHFRLGDFKILDLGRDIDVVLMRQDPPFDLGYITATTCWSASRTRPGGQRPGCGPQCAREGVGARFRPVHAADHDYAVARSRAQVPAKSMARSW